MLFVLLLFGLVLIGFGKFELQLSGVFVIFDVEEDFLVFIFCFDVVVEGGIVFLVKWCYV